MKLTMENINNVVSVEWINKTNEINNQFVIGHNTETWTVNSPDKFGTDIIDNRINSDNIPAIVFQDVPKVVRMETMSQEKYDELLKDLVFEILEKHVFELDWEYGNNNKDLTSKINNLSNSIFLKTKISPANWLIMNPNTETVFIDLIPYPFYSVFTTHFCPEDKIILGFKLESLNANGYHIIRTPVYDEDDIDVWHGLTALDKYAVLNIKNWIKN